MTDFQREMLKTFTEKIFVDGTQGFNSYFIHLITILVIDEFENGLPAAFCFLKKFDFHAMVFFLK